MSFDLDGLRVEHAALEGAVADMGAIVLALGERLDRLATELGPLRSQWAGHQQQAFASAKAEWDAAIAHLREVLDATRLAVQTSNAEYAAADLRGAARFER